MAGYEGAIALLLAFTVIVLGARDVLANGIPIGSIFTGLLTLSGFIFTARTFVTFKLNELVYGNDCYRQEVEKVQADGAYKQNLYAPLRALDADIGKTSIRCLATLGGTMAFSLLPPEWSDGRVSLFDSYLQWRAGEDALAQHFSIPFIFYQISLIVFLWSVASIILRVVHTILSVNRNIRAIIDQWENQYSSRKKQGLN